MARTSLIVAANKKPKYKVRALNRCPVKFGRSHVVEQEVLWGSLECVEFVLEN